MCLKRPVRMNCHPIIERPIKPKPTDSSLQNPRPGGVGPLSMTTKGAVTSKRYMAIQNTP